MDDYEEDWLGDLPNGGKSLLLRMSKTDRAMLDYLRERHQKKLAVGTTYSALLRAMIQASYRKVKAYEASGKKTPPLEEVL